jgi:hypothetical protein
MPAEKNGLRTSHILDGTIVGNTNQWREENCAIWLIVVQEDGHQGRILR